MRARTASLSRYTMLVGVLVLATFVIRLWSVTRWSWNSDDWIYLHDASVGSFLPYVFQVYNGHFMPGEFAIVWLLNAVAPLDHTLVAVVTAGWAAVVAGVWALALRDLWGPRAITWVALLLLNLSPLLVHPTMWWAAALQTLSLQTCFAASLYFLARVVRTGGRAGTVGLVVSYAVGLLMWEKVILLALPLAVVLVHATGGPVLGAVRRHRRVLAWLAGTGAGYAALFLAADRLNGPASENAVRLEPARSVGDIVGFNYDLWAHLLGPGLLGGPWHTLPTPEDYDSRPSVVISTIGLLVLVGLVGWLLRRDRRAWLPLAAAAVYAAIGWGSILFSSRYDVVSWYRLGYERYAIDAFVVLVVLLGEAAARPARSARAAPPGRVAGVAVPALVLSLVVSLGLASTLAILRFGVSPAKPWLANLERGTAGSSSVTLVDRYAPDAVMSPTFWGDRARLSYLLAPWRDRVHFQGPATALDLVDDRGRVAPATFSAVSNAPAGPVASCGYAVTADSPQVVDLDPDLFAYDWVLKVDAFSADAGTLVLRGGEDSYEVSIPRGLSTHFLAFTGAVDTFELRMTKESGTACVTGVSVGNVSAGPGAH